MLHDTISSILFHTLIAVLPNVFTTTRFCYRHEPLE